MFVQLILQQCYGKGCKHLAQGRPTFLSNGPHLRFKNFRGPSFHGGIKRLWKQFLTSMRYLTFLATYKLHDIWLRQARSQELTIGVGLIWGSEGGAPGCRRQMGAGGSAPQKLEIFTVFFLQKTNSVLGTFCCYLKGFKSFDFLTSKEIKSVKNIGCLFS